MSEALDSIFRYKQPDRESVYPTFFIGVGGAGGAMVERTLHKLETRWDKRKFEGLYHGFVLDTDTVALEGYQHIPEGHRILLSDFSKRWYAGSKRGDSYPEEDPFFTQWVHPWYRFRAESGDGAGQIRLESRLSLHYQLEQDRGDIVRTLEQAIRTSRHHDNPFRATKPARMNVHIFSSVAGGTGSGIFLTLAYLMRRLIGEVGHSPRVYGYLMLPGPFFGYVPHVQEREIDANGYAALKELEHLMGLGLEGKHGKDAATFHYSGFHRSETQVETAPFNFVYLLDDPDTVAAGGLSEYKDAVADAMFVQFFSPVFGDQKSGWDNMIKLVGSGTSQGYVLNYGAYGSNVLILPARDILQYCVHRFALDALDRFVLQRSGDEAGAFAVRTDTEEWHQLSAAKQGEKLDDAFLGFVDHLAAQESQRGQEGGVFQAVQAGLSPVTGASLADAFTREQEQLLEKLQVHVSLDRPGIHTFHELDHDVNVPAERMKRDVTRTRSSVEAAWSHVRVDISNGQVLRRFFDEHEVSLIGQRYLLIGLQRNLRERLVWLSNQVASRRDKIDLDSDAIARELKTNQDRMASTSPRTIWEKFRKENADFNAARKGFLEWFNSTLVQGWLELLRLECEQRLTDALVKRIETMLQTFRDLVSHSTELRAQLEHLCGHILRTGGLNARESESNLFAFDTEALRDEDSGERLWDRYYELRFQKNPAWFRAEEVLPAINRAFDPVRDEFGQLRQPDVETIGRRILEQLKETGREKLTDMVLGTEELTEDRSKLGLLLDEALDLEARIVLGLPEGELGERDARAVSERVDAKLRHALRKSDVLCSVRETAADDSISDDRFTMACLHPVYGQDSGLGARLTGQHQCKSNTNWDDPRTVLLYSARLGIPLFWVRSVNERMKQAYREVQRTKVDKRAYPLHIDRNWEHSLPDLDPVERAAERQAAALDEVHVRFAFCRIGGVIERTESTWRIQLDDFERTLGASLPKALEAMEGMRDDLAKRLDAPMAALRAELESPDEPASAWEPVVDYAKALSTECLKLPESNLLHLHRAVVSAYVRHYAPHEVLGAAEPFLAPLPADG